VKDLKVVEHFDMASCTVLSLRLMPDG
jgi:hypothetical protein